MSRSQATSLSKKAATQVAASCPLFRVRRAGRLLDRLYAANMRDLGLTSPQFALLTALRLGHSRIQEIAEVLESDATTVTRAVKPLARNGLVQIEPGEDRRVRHVSLTDSGHALLAPAHRRWSQVTAKLEAGLGDGVLDRFHEAADAVIQYAKAESA